MRCLLLKEHFLTVRSGRLLTSDMEDEMLTVNMVATAHHSAQLLLLDPSASLAFRWETGYKFRRSLCLGPDVPYLILVCCDGKQLFSGLSQTLSPPSSLARQDLTLNPRAPERIIFVALNRKRPKSPLTHIWKNLVCTETRACRTGCHPTLVPSFLLWCCFDPPPHLLNSTLAFLSVSLVLWRLGRQIPRSSLLICQSVNKLTNWLSHTFQAFDLTPP